MVNGIETVAVYVTPEVVTELGEVLKYLKQRGVKVGGAISDNIRSAEILNDAIEYLIEQKYMDGLDE